VTAPEAHIVVILFGAMTKRIKYCKIPPHTSNIIKLRYITLHVPGVKGDSKPVVPHFRMF
jgi:hypothetical protein